MGEVQPTWRLEVAVAWDYDRWCGLLEQKRESWPMGPGLTTAGLQSEADATGLPRSASPPALLPSMEGRQTGSCMNVCSGSRGARDGPAAVQLAGRVARPAGQGWVNGVSAAHPRLRQALARSPQPASPPVCTSSPELLRNHSLSPHTHK